MNVDRVFEIQRAIRLTAKYLDEGLTSEWVAALSYELASSLAAASSTHAVADNLVDSFAAAQKEQMRMFGVGHLHP